jgi:hypothetical protein
MADTTDPKADDQDAAEATTDGNEDEVLGDEVDLEIEGDVFRPDSDAKAEPFHALMELDKDGEATGSVWSFGGRLMLFKTTDVADKVLGSVNSDDTPFGLRGVTHDHLQALKNLASTQKIPLFVVTGITDDGKLEAHAIAEVETPPLPRGLS